MGWQGWQWQQARGAKVGTLAQVVGAVLVGLVLAGCAAGLTRDSPDETKREMARARAQARWDLVIKGDLAGAYEYLSRSSKQMASRQQYVERLSKTEWRTASVETVECQGEACKVSVRFTYDHPMMKGVSNTARETWVIAEGQIWLVSSP